MAGFTAHAEGKQHQRIVKRYINQVIKLGVAPSEIRVSGIQNPGLERWASRKGVVFDKQQQVDVIHPEEVE